MIIAINFSDKNYEEQRKYNTKTAYSKGKADKVIEYSPSDIDVEFREKNSHILSYERGAGLWLWKPYFILKTLEEMGDGDYLLYSDAGAFYVNDIRFLVEALEKANQSVMGFELPLLEKEFTKRESFKLMNCSDYTHNQLLGTYILLKKDTLSTNFVREWLVYSSDERIISPKQFFIEIEETNDFRVHREDQSIFSILYHKNNLVPFRDPSQYGDYPWLYRWNSSITWSASWTYLPKKYVNSDYPRILISCRNRNPKLTLIKEKFRDILNKLGVYNEKFDVKRKSK